MLTVSEQQMHGVSVCINLQKNLSSERNYPPGSIKKQFRTPEFRNGHVWTLSVTSRNLTGNASNFDHRVRLIAKLNK